jgi:hypothetical protein
MSKYAALAKQALKNNLKKLAEKKGSGESGNKVDGILGDWELNDSGKLKTGDSNLTNESKGEKEKEKISNPYVNPNDPVDKQSYKLILYIYIVLKMNYFNFFSFRTRYC